MLYNCGAIILVGFLQPVSDQEVKDIQQATKTCITTYPSAPCVAEIKRRTSGRLDVFCTEEIKNKTNQGDKSEPK